MEMMNIPKEKFQPVKNRDISHDKKLETKPIGYFKDAWNRFRKNKGSVLAFGIIICLVLFSIIAPMVTPYTIEYNDPYFKNCQPKNKFLYESGIDFWDGCKNIDGINETTFMIYQASGVETGKTIIKNNEFKVTKTLQGNRYDIRYNSYHAVGCITITTMSVEEYKQIQAYQNANADKNIQVIYPAIRTIDNDIDDGKIQEHNRAELQSYGDQLWWDYEFAFARKPDGTLSKKKQLRPKVVRDENDEIVFDENGFVQFIGNRYVEKGTQQTRVPNPENQSQLIWVAYDDMYNSTLVEEDGVKAYDYAKPTSDPNTVQVRVDYYEYYCFYHKEIRKDGITEPLFWFGCSESGKDIFANLGGGARLSFIVAIIVSAVNMFVGAIYGSISGYYGGRIDLIMERISEILSAVPMMIVITLLKLHMEGSPHLLILFLSFFATGWIGMAGRVRMQFYRFKNQEYVLAARTLGARDRRIMFKHIFPNSLGTIVTGSVLSIPGVIFSESSLSYLGIINLETGKLTSVGTMLAAGKGTLATFPHIILFPAIFICLLMLSFNLFGNGLRDAFNPSLRGAED